MLNWGKSVEYHHKRVFVALFIGGYAASAANHHKKVGSTDFILFLKILPSSKYQSVKNNTSKKSIALNAI